MSRDTIASKFLFYLAICVAVVVVSLLLTFAGWRIHLNNKIEGKLAKIKAAGLPVSGAEINDWLPSVPDDQNGALVVRQAYALLWTFPDARSNEVADGILLTRTNVWSPHARGLIEEYIRTNGAALAKLLKSVGFSHFRYPVDYSFGPATELPHLREVKVLARLFAYQTVLSAEAGNSIEWPEQVIDLLKIGETLDGEPVLLSHMVRNAILTIAVNTTDRILVHSDVNDLEAEKLQAAFTKCANTNGLPQALIGDRAMNIPIFRLSPEEASRLGQTGEPSSDVPKPQRLSGSGNEFSKLTGFFERDLNFYLETMDAAITLAAKPPPACLELAKQLETAEQVARSRFYICSSMLIPGSSIRRDVTALAQIRAAASAMAVERFRHANARLPERLDELVPAFLDAVPTDPFDGAQLRYRRLERGYVIYSIGADGHDDGGREEPEHRKATDRSTYDITFTVER